jgi:hypothetical protein
MAILPNLLSCQISLFRQQRILFWSSLDGPWLNAPLTISDPLLADQGK